MYFATLAVFVLAAATGTAQGASLEARQDQCSVPCAASGIVTVAGISADFDGPLVPCLDGCGTCTGTTTTATVKTGISGLPLGSSFTGTLTVNIVAADHVAGMLLTE